jgi:hypothetical protein
MPPPEDTTADTRSDDALDRLVDAQLARRPIEPSRDRTEAILERVRAETAAGEPEDTVDALLAERPLRPAEDLTERILARVRSEAESPVEARETTGARPEGSPHTARADNGGKVVGFPSWIAALGSLAAALIIGMAAFMWLFFGANPAQERGGPQVAEEAPTAEGSTGTTAGAPAGEPDAGGASGRLAAADPLLSDRMTDLMALEEELYAVAALLDDTDLQGLDTATLQ